MRYVKFQIVSDDEYGGEGILPNIFKNWDSYSPAIGVSGLAHDLLEHGCRETGAFHQEAAAHGGFLFVRILSGHAGNWAAEKSAVSGLARAYEQSSFAGIAEPPKIIILDKDEHEMLDELFVKMRPEAETDWEQEIDWDLSEDFQACPYTSDEEWSKLTGWIKYGYARAKRRFKGEDYLAYRTFKSLETLIEKEWPKLKDYVDGPQEFTLVLDYEAGEASLRYPWDY